MVQDVGFWFGPVTFKRGVGLGFMMLSRIFIGHTRGDFLKGDGDM